MSATTQTVPIDAELIRQLVPHAGKMCLLERVVSCGPTSICCETRSHLDRANPLRRDGHLSSICAVEYAAQAMALHGALTAPGNNGALTAPGNNGASNAPEFGDTSSTDAPGNPAANVRHGYLASVRDLRCHRQYLDECAGELIVSATLIFSESPRSIYSFVLAHGTAELVTGRAAVVLA